MAVARKCLHCACRINNAGTNAYKYGPLLESDDEDLEAIVDTNVLGVMLCCKEVSTGSRGPQRVTPCWHEAASAAVHGTHKYHMHVRHTRMVRMHMRGQPMRAHVDRSRDALSHQMCVCCRAHKLWC